MLLFYYLLSGFLASDGNVDRGRILTAVYGQDCKEGFGDMQCKILLSLCNVLRVVTFILLTDVINSCN